MKYRQSCVRICSTSELTHSVQPFLSLYLERSYIHEIDLTLMHSVPHLDATLRKVGITPLRKVSPCVDDGLRNGTVQRMVLVAHGPPLLRYHKALVKDRADHVLSVHGSMQQRHIGLNRKLGLRNLLSTASPLSE